MDQYRVQYLVRKAMHAYRERQLKLREWHLGDALPNYGGRPGQAITTILAEAYVVLFSA